MMIRVEVSVPNWHPVSVFFPMNHIHVIPVKGTIIASFMPLKRWFELKGKQDDFRQTVFLNEMCKEHFDSVLFQVSSFVLRCKDVDYIFYDGHPIPFVQCELAVFKGGEHQHLIDVEGDWEPTAILCELVHQLYLQFSPPKVFVNGLMSQELLAKFPFIVAGKRSTYKAFSQYLFNM